MSVKAKATKPLTTKDELDQILRQFNKLKGENSTLYTYVQMSDKKVLFRLINMYWKQTFKTYFNLLQSTEGQRCDGDRCWEQTESREDTPGPTGEGERREADTGSSGVRKVGLKVWDHNLITIAFTKDMKRDIFVFFANDYWQLESGLG